MMKHRNLVPNLIQRILPCRERRVLEQFTIYLEVFVGQFEACINHLMSNILNQGSFIWRGNPVAKQIGVCMVVHIYHVISVKDVDNDIP